MEVTFVIIGGGIAGVSCIKTLSFLAPEEPAILVTSTSLVKVVTNIISVGKMSMQLEVEEQSSENLSNLHPNLTILNDTVININSAQKLVETEGGKVIKFKKICICTGARPHLIADSPFVLGIRDVESVENFSKKIDSAKRILIVGNGGIATEIVYKIENVDVIWAIKDRHIAATFVDAGAAEFFKPKILKCEKSEEKCNKTEKFNENSGTIDKSHEKSCEKLPQTDKTAEKSTYSKRIKYTVSQQPQANGSKRSPKIDGAALGPDWQQLFTSQGSSSCPRSVEIEYECEVVQILTPAEANCTDWPIFAELTNKKLIGCDFIVSATGVEPNSELGGLELAKKGQDGGLLVNWKLETSLEDVFAAGDVCSADWELAEHWLQMRLWTQAYQMGCFAAKAMASALKHEEILQDFCFELFTHVTKFFGYKVVLLGLFNGQKLENEYEILLRMTRGEEYIKLVIKNGKLQGAVLIGNTDLEEMCENLILNQLDISIYGEDLLHPDIDIEDYFD